MNYKTYTVKEFENGTKHWYKDGELHREDGPAIEWKNGYKLWYKDGKQHRENGPAIEFVNGDKHWLKDDKLHREDGPAIEERIGINKWYLNGVRYCQAEYDFKIYDKKSKTYDIKGKQVSEDTIHQALKYHNACIR